MQTIKFHWTIILCCIVAVAHAQDYDRTKFEQYPSYEELCLHYALQDTAYGMPTNNESIFRFEKTQKGWYVRKMKSDGQSLQTLFYKQVWSASKQAYLKEVDSTALNPQMLQSVT